MAHIAIICDIDGTVANLEHRLHHINKKTPDWEAFHSEVHKDAPIPHIIHLIKALSDYGYTILMCSGRMEYCREPTIAWLDKWEIPWNDLYMRPNKDYRPDWQIKEEILQDLLVRYNIIMAIDDRQQVVDMWRRNQIPCLQVAEGNF